MIVKIKFSLLILVTFFTAESWAILCYDCVAASAAKCHSASGLEYTQCYEPINYDKRINNSRAACLKAFETVDGVERSYRGCGIQNGPEDSCRKLSKVSSTITCMTCDDNYCNSSNAMEIKMWIIGVVTFISTYFAILRDHSP